MSSTSTKPPRGRSAAESRNGHGAGHAAPGGTDALPHAADQVKLIPTNLIAASEMNPRKIFHGITELAESIQAQGLLQYLQVRPDADGYELVAGERRLRACRQAGLTEVPCIVRTLTDDQAREIIVTENLQREGLHPLEEAAGVATLLESGRTAKEIAARLGRDVRWVAQRAKLCQLAKPFRSALETGKLERWTIGHFEAIATLVPAAQEAFWKELPEWSRENMSIETLARNIGEWSLKIVSAPWKADDASLPGGACFLCPKRSSRSPELFDEHAEDGDELLPRGAVLKHDRCLDRTCWEKRVDEFTRRKTQELADIHGEQLVQLDASVPRYDEKKRTAAAKQGRLNPDRVLPAKKTDPKARPAIVTDGHGKGQVKWVKPAGNESWKKLGLPGAAEEKAGAKKKPATQKRPLAEREAELHAKRRRKAAEGLRDFIDGVLSHKAFDPQKNPIARPRQESLIALVAVFGMTEPLARGFNDAFEPEAWPTCAAVEQEETGNVGLNLLWWGVLDRLLERLKEPWGNAVQIADHVYAEAKFIAPIVCFDLEDALTEAAIAIPEPASWAKERTEQGSRGAGEKKRRKKASTRGGAS